MDHVPQAGMIPARKVTEGAGVTVHRTIGTPALRSFDPFLMLDHFSSDNPEDYIAGFPPHPHRGFITFTYMIDGHMKHQDSMGNMGNLGPGDAQWMKAASGIIHSEMPQQENGLMRGFQLWINLPAAHKMDDPEYREYSAHNFPQLQTEAWQAKLLIGRFADSVAPIADENTDVCCLEASVNPHGEFKFKQKTGYHTAFYVFEGSAQINGQSVPSHSLVTLAPKSEDNILIAGESGARFFFMTGSPINEPVVQSGPFVMNTQQEIEQAIHDYQSNRLVRRRASMTRDS